MTGFSALGFDPAPGDVSAVRAIVHRLDRGLGSVDSALSLLTHGADASWQGEAADAFRDAMDADFQPQLEDIGDAFRTSRTALSLWADELADFQIRARELEDQAADALAQVVRHDAERDTLLNHARIATLTEAEQHDLRRASSLASTYSGQLDSLRAQADRLQRDADARASTAAASLKESASTLSMHGGSFWDKVGSSLSDVWDAVSDGFDWFMTNVMPILEDIIDTIGPILAVVALFTPFMPILGTIAIALAVAAVAIDGLQALRGEEGAAAEFWMGLGGLAVGGALGKMGASLGNGTREVFTATINGGGMAFAGGGAAAGSLTLALRFNPSALTANTMWMATKLTEAHVSGVELQTALLRPAINLVERGRNLVSGDGPRTDEELYERR